MFVVFWRGRGWLGVVVPMVCFGIAQATAQGSEAGPVAILVAACIAGVAVWMIAARLSRRGRPNRSDTFLFVPLKYWAFVWPIGAMLAAVF